MKNQIILWLSSLVIVFLIGFVKSVTDDNYPITGTFGIEGYKVSYKLDKESYEKSTYKNIVISDIKGVTGRIIWFIDEHKNETEMIELDRSLVGEIPILKAGQKINYKIELTYKNKAYLIPQNDLVTLTFWGKIPSTIRILHFILLYGGMLVLVRSLLEIFNQNKSLKKYLFIANSLFLIFTIIINPLRNSYKLGALNSYVPPVFDLLEPNYLITSALIILGTILIFNKIFPRMVIITTTIVAILLFFLT